MSANVHNHHDSSRTRQPITIVTTDQGPRVGPYIFGKTLGTGSTGKVKLAKNLNTNEIVAIKIVRKDYLDNKPSLRKKMRREISVLKVLSHPNLMSLIDVFEIETHLFLVMEFVDGLELFEYLVRRGALPIPQALSFFQQIICGLEYCHRRLICHRDLKPENLLLDRNLNIKIADFGMTSLNPPGGLLETSCGSPHYCDPMVVSGEMYDGLKADIWSCGVILYAMVTGRLPFDDDNVQRLLQKVQVGAYHLPSDLPKDLRDLIKQMLTVDPEQRITLDGIKAHPWFNSIPPTNYVEDNFVAPTEPVETPDPVIMRSLVDLGWGDAKSIRDELAKEGSSMAKVFYQQLERHPMTRRSAASHSSSSSSNSGRSSRADGSHHSQRHHHHHNQHQHQHQQHHHQQQHQHQQQQQHPHQQHQQQHPPPAQPIGQPVAQQPGIVAPVAVAPNATAPVAAAAAGEGTPGGVDASALRDRLAAISLRGAPDGPAGMNGGEATEAVAAPVAADAGVGTEAGGAPPTEQLSSPVASAGHGEVAANAVENVNDGENLGDPDDVPPGSNGGAALVRQSSLLMSADGMANNHQKVEEAIETVASSKQKSWFDSLSNYFTGGEKAGSAGTPSGSSATAPTDQTVSTDDERRAE